jgi:hypothetical protein
MNFYWIKLGLSRLKLKDFLDARYIYFIFLNHRTDQDLSKEICFIIFWLQINLVQIFELARIWIYFRNWIRKLWPHGPNPAVSLTGEVDGVEVDFERWWLLKESGGDRLGDDDLRGRRRRKWAAAAGAEETAVRCAGWRMRWRGTR